MILMFRRTGFEISNLIIQICLRSDKNEMIPLITLMGSAKAITLGTRIAWSITSKAFKKSIQRTRTEVIFKIFGNFIHQNKDASGSASCAKSILTFHNLRRESRSNPIIYQKHFDQARGGVTEIVWKSASEAGLDFGVGCNNSSTPLAWTWPREKVLNSWTTTSVCSNEHFWNTQKLIFFCPSWTFLIERKSASIIWAVLDKNWCEEVWGDYDYKKNL